VTAQATPTLRTNTAWCLLGNIVARGNIFFGLMILKHFLPDHVGDSEAGCYTVAWATASAVFAALAQPVTTLQTLDTQKRHTAEDYLGLRLVLWVPAWLIIAAVAVVFGMTMGAAMAGALVAGAGVKWSESLNETIYGGLQQTHRNDLVTHSQLLRGGVSLLAMLAAGFAGQGAAVILTAMTLTNLTVFLLHDRTRLWRLYHNSSPNSTPALRPRFDRNEFRTVFLTSLPLIGVVGLAMVNPNIPRYVLAAEYGKAAAGRFGIIVFFVFAMMQIVDAMGRAASPYLAEAYSTRQMRTFFTLAGKLLAWMIPLGGAGLLGGIYLGRWALTIGFGSDAASNSGDLEVMMLLGWVYCFASMLGYIATAMHRFKTLLIATLLSGAVALIVSLEWVPPQKNRGPSGDGIEMAILALGAYCIASVVCLSGAIAYGALTRPATKID
jgi:O-antigen/teichoic acid export membrane protein